MAPAALPTIGIVKPEGFLMLVDGQGWRRAEHTDFDVITCLIFGSTWRFKGAHAMHATLDPLAVISAAIGPDVGSQAMLAPALQAKQCLQRSICNVLLAV